MLPAEISNVADRTRAQRQRRDGDNPEDVNPDPEVILPGGLDGNNPNPCELLEVLLGGYIRF